MPISSTATTAENADHAAHLDTVAVRHRIAFADPDYACISMDSIANHTTFRPDMESWAHPR